ncbi:hypothetical protein V6N11_062634 [Hibiscus sabdariffa]|uniref:Protein kinase domain-containing protein n=1 Tax=Hibiscus sabdariffa TaxID=183260 RepID=A0ABR2PT76_9ROSI
MITIDPSKDQTLASCHLTMVAYKSKLNNSYKSRLRRGQCQAKMSQLCFSILLLLFVSVPVEAASQAVDTERTVLLKLKQQLGNPTSLAHWNSSSSPCDWPEIYCTTNSVTEVHLRDKNITASVPPTICGLKNLTYLDLYNNFIPGEFPTLYNCSKLQFLDLSHNYFVGPLPDEIDRLSTLVYLDISGNNFSGDIPPSIGRLPALNTLSIVQNQFNGTFPKEIGNLSNLEVLEMAYNEFVPMKIPREFGQLTKLLYLWMTRTNLIGKIPESFDNLSDLKHLDLAVNNLEGPIFSRLFSLKNLTIVYLFHNKLSGEIPKTVDALRLIKVDLSMNDLTGSIPEDFGKLQNLESLNLAYNQLTGELPTSISQLPALRDFRIFQNKLSGVLPSEFGLHSELEGFEVSENQFSGPLPPNLCAGGVLQGVVAYTNNLNGRIPESLGNCPTLRTIQLHNNKFSGEIPRRLWMIFNLSTVLLTNNSFSGKLPSRLAWNVSRIEISNNKFSGEIPTGIASWSNLVVFQASNNLFSGKIPKEITSLSRLTTLLLDGNDFSGELPSEIISWRSLTTLDVSNNKLTGEIPVAIGSLPDLLNLDLSENQFSGGIPSEIGNLRLTSLNLSSNQLVGKIPKQLNNLAFETSFLQNSDLCADHPVLKLPDCNSKLHQPDKLSSKCIVMIVALSILASTIILLLSLFLVRDYRRKKHGQYLATWKLTSFQRLGFTKGNILSDLTENNLIGSGGSGKVYRININRSDFGLAKMLTGQASAHSMSTVAGSFGYLAPEYAYTTKVNTKVDVYSFGVVLLELVTGREANSAVENMNLAEWAWQHFSEDKPIVEILDPLVKETSYLEEMILVYKVGILCTHASPSNRPSMKEVSHILRDYCLPNGHAAKNVGSNFDVAPLLGSDSPYLSSYEHSKNGSEDNMINII